MTQTPTALADAREQFLAMVAGVRPELHRYCARLTGSVIEGGDIVQKCRPCDRGSFELRTTRRSIS